MERFLPLIAEILDGDKNAPKKQRHTAQRVYDRLVAEHAFDGSYSSVKEAVRDWRQGRQEVFLPLSHPPGEAQVDFGYAYIDLDGLREQVALFVMTLPHSDAVYLQAFPREGTESFQEGHKRAFEFFGGVPRRISYDNSRVAFAKITSKACSAAASSFPAFNIASASRSLRTTSSGLCRFLRFWDIASLLHAPQGPVRLS
jgi:transposase